MGYEKTDLSGVIPELAMRASSEFGDIPLVECGIGTLMPWADKLWAITYVAHGETTGDGTRLYEIDDELNAEKHPESVVGTFADRMVHEQSDQAIIGPHVIDTSGNVRTFEQLLEGVYEPAEGEDGIETRLAKRLTATMVRLEDPENKVYFLTMEGILFEAGGPVDVEQVDRVGAEFSRLFSTLSKTSSYPRSSLWTFVPMKTSSRSLLASPRERVPPSAQSEFAPVDRTRTTSFQGR